MRPVISFHWSSEIVFLRTLVALDLRPATWSYPSRMIRAAWDRPFNGVMATNSNEIAELSEQVTGRLHERFPRIPINTVQEIVEEIYDGYDGCRIRAFIPLLVERASRDRLRLLPLRLVNADTHVQVRAGVTGTAPTRCPSGPPKFRLAGVDVKLEPVSKARSPSVCPSLRSVCH